MKKAQHKSSKLLMPIAHIHLPELEQKPIIEAIEPILEAHEVDGVELVWKTDRGGAVLELTIEVPNTRQPGQGVTVDICTSISRQISEFLDENDLIKSDVYRLDVGSPGVERQLYSLNDYRRFAGYTAKIKLDHILPGELSGGQKLLRGTLGGLTEDAEPQIILQKKKGDLLLSFSSIEKASLVFSWGQSQSQVTPSRGRPIEKK